MQTGAKRCTVRSKLNQCTQHMGWTQTDFFVNVSQKRGAHSTGTFSFIEFCVLFCAAVFALCECVWIPNKTTFLFRLEIIEFGFHFTYG